MNFHRLLIDVSSILRACHFVVDKENGYKVHFEGRQVQVNSAEHAYGVFMQSYLGVLQLTGTAPFQTVLVKDGYDSRRLRQMFYPEYKGKRSPQPPELNEEYKIFVDGVVDEILAMGGTVMVQHGMEADDVIAYLSQNLAGHKTIWSRDGDMLALRKDDVDVLYQSTEGPQLNPDIYKSCPADRVLIYKSLVGDTSDNLPGAKGFGPAAFVKMVQTFGIECLDTILSMLQDRALDELEDAVAEFKPLGTILKNKDAVYASYACAQFYPQKVNLASDPLEIRTGMVEQWDPEIRYPALKDFFGSKLLLTADKFEELFPVLAYQFAESPYVTLDIETSATPEGEEWAQRIDDSKKGRKSNTVDVFGAVLTGMSLTYGNNVQRTLYIPVDHASEGNCTPAQVKRLLSAIPEHIIRPIHNATGFELPVLFTNLGEWFPHAVCTMLMKSYVDENTPLGLKECSKQYFGYEQTTYEQVTTLEGPPDKLFPGGKLLDTYQQETGPDLFETWERRKYRMNELPVEHVFDYGCDDTICTSALYNRLLLTMELEHTLYAFCECELTTQYWAAEAFVNGVDVDLEELARLDAEDSIIWGRNWEIVKDFLMERGWDGTTFTPYDLSPVSIKAAFELVTGRTLDTRVRKLEKLAEACVEQEAPELAELILKGDLEEYNSYLEAHFEPGPNFSLAKSADKCKFLYETLGLPVRFRNKVTDTMRANNVWTGNPSGDAACFEHALALDVAPGSPEEAVLKAIVEMNRVETRRKMYYKPYPLYQHWKDGRYHVNLGQCKTVTRRFAPSAVNLNQVPKKGDGVKIRKTYKAPAGWLWASFDWRGQELALAASKSGDVVLTTCFVGENKQNAHALTAASIAKKRGLEIADYNLLVARKKAGDAEAKKYYNLGKGTNFSSQYLCQAPKLAKLLITTVEDAQEFLDAKNATFYGLAAWQQSTIEKAHAIGYTETYMGARRHLYDKLNGPDSWAALEAERQGVNFEIQGSGGEMAKGSINEMWRNGSPNYWTRGMGDDIAILFPVHDEGDFLVRIDENLTDNLMFLHSKMIRQYSTMPIPMESELSIGVDFGSLVGIGVTVNPETIKAALKEVFPDES